jgi:hypothetical protein
MGAGMGRNADMGSNNDSTFTELIKEGYGPFPQGLLP